MKGRRFLFWHHAAVREKTSARPVTLQNPEFASIWLPSATLDCRSVQGKAVFLVEIRRLAKGQRSYMADVGPI
jgi:hypothetical protein